MLYPIIVVFCICNDFIYYVSMKNLTVPDDYKGEHFPPKYLGPDEIVPTLDDINLYVSSLERLISYCSKQPNDTDVNQALGVYYVKALLKRSLLDYDYKIYDRLRARLKELIEASEFVISHFLYRIKPLGWHYEKFRVAYIFKEDENQVYSIEKFNRHRLVPWLLRNSNMHSFTRAMDTLTLPREKYVDLVANRTGYHIAIKDSDKCISKIVYNPLLIDRSHLSRCKLNKKCDRVIHSTPSITYSLSHRLLNVMLIRHVRRCYLRSPDGDVEQMDEMCAQMYREAVYLARRGFFARDMFLEHLALCGLLGYDEFHRRNWYHRSAGWVDAEGCIVENRNFQVNSSRIDLEKYRKLGDRKKLKQAAKENKQDMLEPCMTHPMSVLKVVLAQGIRHALRYLPRKPSD